MLGITIIYGCKTLRWGKDDCIIGDVSDAKLKPRFEYSYKPRLSNKSNFYKTSFLTNFTKLQNQQIIESSKSTILKKMESFFNNLRFKEV